jgi:hypothetical protein
MLRDNLAGLIEPMSDGVGAEALVVVQKAKNRDAMDRPRWQSSILGHPGAKFFAEKRAKGKMAGFAVPTEAHVSRAVCTEAQKSHRTIDPQCLENPRPEGAESTLTRERCLSIFR